MKIYSVRDKEFAPYGKVIEGIDVDEMCTLLKNFKKENGTAYVASDNFLESTSLAKTLKDNVFGGLETEVGCCYGVNTKLNCLEYHSSSEINLSNNDFILLLAKEEEITDGSLDTTKVKAFLCPARTVINVFATTLHYAPCCAHLGEIFSVMVALPKFTNTDYKPKTINNIEDKMLFARNKWLIAHPESDEAKNGAYVGLIGENLDIKNLI